jgi:TPR repeat protein
MASYNKQSQLSSLAIGYYNMAGIKVAQDCHKAANYYSAIAENGSLKSSR